MKCKWAGCENEARAKSPFCSGTCKKRYQRASGTDVPVEVGQEQVGQGESVPVVSYAHYMNNLSKYAIRREPELLNWGPWMNSQQLAMAGLKANRVAVPGDWDYKGVCYEDEEGVWHVRKQGACAV